LDLSQDGQLIFQMENPEEGYPIFLKFAERGGYEEYVIIDDEYFRYEEGTTQELVFVLKEGVLSISIEGNFIQTIELPYAEKAFWIGYRLPTQGRIKAHISNFQISEFEEDALD
jgi:hypothetical protein